MIKTIFKTVLLLVAIVSIGSCEHDDSQIFAAGLKDKGEFYTLTYGPSMKFEEIVDSSNALFRPKDFDKILGGPIKKSDFIVKKENFHLRLFLIENYAKGYPSYQLLLRTFSNNMKIIDDFIIASTLENELSDGYLTEGLRAVRKYKDSTKVVMQIDDYGTFKNTTK